jgi:hypothetical protein
MEKEHLAQMTNAELIVVANKKAHPSDNPCSEDASLIDELCLRLRKIDRKELNQPTYYVVVEHNRCLGTTVKAVYADKVEADKHSASSSHMYVEESIFHLQYMGDI